MNINKEINTISKELFNEESLTISLASGVIQDIIFESLQRKYDKKTLKFLHQYNRVGTAMLATAVLYMSIKKELNK